MSDFFKDIKKVKDISVLQLLEVCYILLICYIVIDVNRKVNEFKKYDTVKLMEDIREMYPHSFLRYQNIEIYGDDFYCVKTSVVHVNSYFYIRNNKLIPEKGNKFLLYSCLPIFCFAFLRKLLSGIKVRELYKISGRYYGCLLGVYLVTFLFFHYTEEKKQLRFDRLTQFEMNKIDLSNIQL